MRSREVKIWDAESSNGASEYEVDEDDNKDALGMESGWRCACMKCGMGCDGVQGTTKILESVHSNTDEKWNGSPWCMAWLGSSLGR